MSWASPTATRWPRPASWPRSAMGTARASPCAPTWMGYPSTRRPTSPSAAPVTARCTPAAMTATSRCFWAPPACSSSATPRASYTARSSLFSSPPKKAEPGGRKDVPGRRSGHPIGPADLRPARVAPAQDRHGRLAGRHVPRLRRLAGHHRPRQRRPRRHAPPRHRPGHHRRQGRDRIADHRLTRGRPDGAGGGEHHHHPRGRGLQRDPRRPCG